MASFSRDNGRPSMPLSDASDTSLHSCNSFDALKQWTTSTPVPPPNCCPAAHCCCIRSKRGGSRRSTRKDGDEQPNDNTSGSNCTSNRKRLFDQGRYTAHCLLSDWSEDEPARPLSDDNVNINVDNGQPAFVEIMSCDSSFSDCNLPCHELITCSKPEQLARGRIKVSVRPPTVSGGGQCYDDDRLNIKFVSHFADVPDKQKNDNNAKDKRDSKVNDRSRKSSSLSRSSQFVSQKSSRRSSEGKRNKNTSSRPSGYSPWSKNTSSRPGYSSLSTTEQSELESREDLERKSKRGRRSRHHPRSSNAYSDEDDKSTETTQEHTQESTQESTQTMSSCNDDDNELRRTFFSDTEEKEIVMLYGKVREIIRGPVVTHPGECELIPKLEVAIACEDKETFSGKTVIIEAPSVMNPTETSPAECDIVDNAVTVSVCNDSKPKDADETLTTKVQSSTMKFVCKTTCDRSSETDSPPKDNTPPSCMPHTSGGAVAVPRSSSAPQMSDDTDRCGARAYTEDSDRDDTAVVVARRTRPAHSSGTSPWKVDGRGSVSVPQPDRQLNVSQQQHQQQRQQEDRQQLRQLLRRQQQHVESVQLRYVYREEMRPASRRTRDELFQMYRESLMMPTDKTPLKAAVDSMHYPLQSFAVANVGAESSTSLPPVLYTRESAAIQPSPRRLTSCLKKSTSSGATPTSHSPCSSQRRRRIRFATDVCQETL